MNVTVKQMCKTISRYWRRKYKIRIHPKKIFNYSPSGELFQVFFWYKEAITWLKKPNKLERGG